MTPDLFTTAKFAIKTLSLIGLFVYILFAFVIVRQETRMRNILEEDFEPIMRIIIYLHFAAAIALFIFALLILP
jgi:hypothetical protein